VRVAALPGHPAHVSAAAVPAPLAMILEHPFPAVQAAAQVRLAVPAASARSAEATAAEAAGVPRHVAVVAPAARNAAAHRWVVAAEAAVAQHEAALRPEAAAQEVSALVEAAVAVAVAAEPHGVAVVVVAAEPGAAAGLQPEAVVEAERDGAVRPQAAAPGAAGLPQAVVPSVPLSASVCRRGRLRPRAVPPALRPAARSARGRRSLLSAAPKWRWWQAAQVEV
jgi:hypothetical protein